MSGPAPKSAGMRARRNLPAGGEWTTLPPLIEPVLPDLGDVAPGAAWSPRVLALWSGWRQDFATQLYGPSEIAMAVELAYLVDNAITGGKATMWIEALKWMDSLALTPKGKRIARVCPGDPPAAGAVVNMTPDFRRDVAMPSVRDRRGPLIDSPVVREQESDR